MMAVTSLVDYRELFKPKGIGYSGPHNKLFSPEGYFHRPANDHFSDNMPGDAVISLGVRSDRRYPAEYKYDAHGFRNSKDVTSPFALLVGDSFIEGYKITQDHIVSERLAYLLGEDTFNLAQSDYGPYEELLALKSHIERLRPKVLIWFFYEGNDLPNLDYNDFVLNNKKRQRNMNRYEYRSFFSNLSSVLVRWSSMAIKHNRTRDLADKRSGHFVGTDRNGDTTMYFEIEPPQNYQQQLHRIRFVLETVKTLSDENGARVLLVYIPTKYSIYKSHLEFPGDSDVADWKVPDLANRIAEMSLSLDLAFIDLNPVFQQAVSNKNLVYYLDDEHWTPEGHELVAREVMSYMQEMGWLDQNPGLFPGTDPHQMWKTGPH